MCQIFFIYLFFNFQYECLECHMNVLQNKAGNDCSLVMNPEQGPKPTMNQPYPKVSV